MQRLGWSNLTLEPEHLTDRVVDALNSLEARYERVDPSGGDAEEEEVFVVNAEISGVAVRLVVTRDPDSASGAAYRVMCTRLGGDTFSYHSAFRKLRSLLGEAVAGGQSLPVRRGGGGGGLGGGARALGGQLGLAPLPAWSEVSRPAMPEPPAPTGGGEC